MTNKQKRPDEEKTWRDQGSQNDRNRGGQHHQDSDPQTDPRRQQGGWTTDEDGRPARGGSVRDSDSGEKLVDEP